jgi:hypothetical protein
MLHAYVEIFDVMGGRGNILGWDGEVNKALSGYMFGPTRVLLRVRASTHAHNSPAH